jgi:nitrogen regulatory protein P-II 2
MLFTKRKLITIIAEKALETKLADGVRLLGAAGFTVSEAGGSGSRGLRTFELEGKNIRMEIITSADTAERIAVWVSDTFFKHHAVVLYLQDVEVIRDSKYP